VDIDNLELDGLTLLEELKRTGADLPVILIADRAKAASVRAVKLLIADLLEKPFTDDFVVGSVRKVQKLLLAQSWTHLEQTSVDRLALLSERERAILERIVSGKSNKSIASSLGMELRTVELCRASAMNKLGVASLKELIRLALAAGIALGASQL
jgi:two-component system response regulator FixJ